MTTAAKRRGRVLPSRFAFALLVATFGSFALSSTVPTPLYGVYAHKWGLSAVTITVVFAVYAAAVLATLLTCGRLSDYLGRRPLLVAGIAMQALGAILFIVARGAPELMLARVAQGAGIGLGTPAVGAALLDLHVERGARASAVAPLVGTAVGSLLSGILVAYLPWRTTLVYVILLAILVAEGAGVLFIAETSPRAPGALRSLHPRLVLPAAARRAVLVTAPVLIAIWTLFGFYGSLGPTLLYRISGSSSVAVGGLILCAYGGAAAFATVAFRRLAATQMLFLASGALIAGVAGCLASVASGSLVPFLAATLVSGIGFGAGLQGAFRIVMPLGTPEQRGGLVSILYLIMYVAFGLPAVAAGFLVVYGGGIRSTAYIYGALVIALGGLALVGLLPARRRTSEFWKGAS